MLSAKFVWAIVLLFALNAHTGIHTVNGKRGHYRRVMPARVRPELSLLPLPLFRSLNSDMALPTANEDKVISPDYAPTAPTSADEDNGDDGVMAPVSNVRAFDDTQSGRTFKHLIMLRGLLGSGTGTGSGTSSSGGYSIPYIIINQPMNFTNTNNNSLVNNPPPTTTATTRRRREAPIRYLPIPINTAPAQRPPTAVYHERMNEQAQEQPQFSIAIPAPAAAAMLGLSINDLLPYATAFPNVNGPPLRQRYGNVGKRRNPLESFANNLKGIPFF